MRYTMNNALVLFFLISLVRFGLVLHSSTFFVSRSVHCEIIFVVVVAYIYTYYRKPHVVLATLVLL